MTNLPDPNCLFCRIAAEELPSDIVHQDATFFAFRDIHPKAPVHIVIIPKEHAMASIADMSDDQRELIGRMIGLARDIAAEQGMAADGYRLVFNVRHHGGQEVDHVHLHILGGQPLGPLG